MGAARFGCLVIKKQILVLHNNGMKSCHVMVLSETEPEGRKHDPIKR